MFVKIDECLPGSLLPSVASPEHRPSLPQGGEGFSLADPDQLDLFRPRFIQQSFKFACEWCGAPITEDVGGACADCYFGAFMRGAPPMPEGARRTECLECGYTYGTHARWCPEEN